MPPTINATLSRTSAVTAPPNMRVDSTKPPIGVSISTCPATALLARIERHNGKYNAFISLAPERALTAARTAEAEIAAGRWRGSFHPI